MFFAPNKFNYFLNYEDTKGRETQRNAVNHRGAVPPWFIYVSSWSLQQNGKGISFLSETFAIAGVACNTYVAQRLCEGPQELRSNYSLSRFSSRNINKK
jgi:hypothetical protein